MSAESILKRAEDALDRHRAESRLVKRVRARRRATFFGRIKRIVFAWVTILVAMAVWGIFIGPVGVTGVLIAALGFFAAAVALMIFPSTMMTSTEPEPTTELAQLPLQTEDWLLSQRRLLPPPATRLIDGIGIKLEQLAPQLERVDAREPIAVEARKLIGEDLPELVKSYTQVPPSLRKQGANGIKPDKHLVDALITVDGQLARISEQLAAGDLTKLATQGRYLELKYQGDSVA